MCCGAGRSACAHCGTRTAQKKTTTKNHPADDFLCGLACITSNSQFVNCKQVYQSSHRKSIHNSYKFSQRKLCRAARDSAYWLMFPHNRCGCRCLSLYSMVRLPNRQSLKKSTKRATIGNSDNRRPAGCADCKWMRLLLRDSIGPSATEPAAGRWTIGHLPAFLCADIRRMGDHLRWARK